MLDRASRRRAGGTLAPSKTWSRDREAPRSLARTRARPRQSRRPCTLPGRPESTRVRSRHPDRQLPTTTSQRAARSRAQRISSWRTAVGLGHQHEDRAACQSDDELGNSVAIEIRVRDRAGEHARQTLIEPTELHGSGCGPLEEVNAVIVDRDDLQCGIVIEVGRENAQRRRRGHDLDARCGGEVMDRNHTTIAERDDEIGVAIAIEIDDASDAWFVKRADRDRWQRDQLRSVDICTLQYGLRRLVVEVADLVETIAIDVAIDAQPGAECIRYRRGALSPVAQHFGLVRPHLD